MFRRRFDDEEDPRPSMLGMSKPMLEYYAEWAREFVLGGKVDKPKALVLSGYAPVQNASYFILPLAPGIHLYGLDRQLKLIDSRQKHFFVEWLREHPEAAPWVLLPDPLFRFGAPSRTGTAMIQTLGFDFHARPHFLLSGDVHHYARSAEDGTLHSIAGWAGPSCIGPRVGGAAASGVAQARRSRESCLGVPEIGAALRFLPHWCSVPCSRQPCRSACGCTTSSA